MNNLKIYAFADEAGSSLESQITAMQRTKINGLEIRNVDYQNIKDISNFKAREIKSAMDNSGLEIWSLGSPIGKIGIKDNFAPHLDNFRRLLEINEILQAKAIRIFSFYMPKDECPAAYRDTVFERMEQFVRAAKGSNALLCHENEKGIYGDNAARCLDICKNISGISAVFDPANFIQCNQNTIEAWNMLRPYVTYLHIKDCLADGIVVPAGDGIGNVEAIVSNYAACGGKCVTIEPHLTEFVGLLNLEREGEKSAIATKRYATNDEAFDAAVAAFRTISE